MGSYPKGTSQMDYLHWPGPPLQHLQTLYMSECDLGLGILKGTLMLEEPQGHRPKGHLEEDMRTQIQHRTTMKFP